MIEPTDDYPENYRSLVTNKLMSKFGDSISLRSIIVLPPKKVGVIIKNKSVITYNGRVSFQIVNRKSDLFGIHQIDYELWNNEVKLNLKL